MGNKQCHHERSPVLLGSGGQQDNADKDPHCVSKREARRQERVHHVKCEIDRRRAEAESHHARVRTHLEQQVAAAKAHHDHRRNKHQKEAKEHHARVRAHVEQQVAAAKAHHDQHRAKILEIKAIRQLKRESLRADLDRHQAGGKCANRHDEHIQRHLEKMVIDALAKNDDEQVENILDLTLGPWQRIGNLPPTLSRAACSAATKLLAAATQSGEPKRLKAAFVAARRLQATHVPEFAAALAKYKEVRQLPQGWDLEKMLAENRAGNRLLAKPDMSNDLQLKAMVQRMFDVTTRKVYTRDRNGEPVPEQFEVVQVNEVQNEEQWVNYLVRRETIKSEILECRAAGLNDADFCIPVDAATRDALGEQGEASNEQEVPHRASQNFPGPPLEFDANEVWLMHGTKPIAAERITSDDFRIDLAGSSTGSLYGRGIYAAENSTKADEYSDVDPATGLHTILLCRATLGKLRVNSDVSPDPRECEDACLQGEYHAVLGDRRACRGTFREFVVFDEDQIYPNYVVSYRRIMHSTLPMESPSPTPSTGLETDTTFCHSTASLTEDGSESNDKVSTNASSPEFDPRGIGHVQIESDHACPRESPSLIRPPPPAMTVAP